MISTLCSPAIEPFNIKLSFNNNWPAPDKAPAIVAEPFNVISPVFTRELFLSSPKIVVFEVSIVPVFSKVYITSFVPNKWIVPALLTFLNNELVLLLVRVAETAFVKSYIVSVSTEPDVVPSKITCASLIKVSIVVIPAVETVL